MSDLVNIKDERFWQILFDEACVEGQQAERIEKELKKITVEPVRGEWIPCSEKLPNESGTYIISANDGHINHVSFTKWMPRFRTWALSGCRSYWKVKAWMPLPEPYRPEEDER